MNEDGQSKTIIGNELICNKQIENQFILDTEYTQNTVNKFNLDANPISIDFEKFITEKSIEIDKKYPFIKVHNIIISTTSYGISKEFKEFIQDKFTNFLYTDYYKIDETIKVYTSDYPIYDYNEGMNIVGPENPIVITKPTDQTHITNWKSIEINYEDVGCNKIDGLLCYYYLSHYIIKFDPITIQKYEKRKLNYEKKRQIKQKLLKKNGIKYSLHNLISIRSQLQCCLINKLELNYKPTKKDEIVKQIDFLINTIKTLKFKDKLEFYSNYLKGGNSWTVKSNRIDLEDKITKDIYTKITKNCKIRR